MALLSACHRLVSWHLQHPTPAIDKQLDLSRKISYGQMVKWRYLEMADPSYPWGIPLSKWLLPQFFIWNIHEYPHYYGMKYGLYMVIYTHWIPLADQCRNMSQSCQQGHRQQLSGPILWSLIHHYRDLKKTRRTSLELRYFKYTLDIP